MTDSTVLEKSMKNDRDARGRLLPGNTVGKGVPSPGSGPRPSLKTQFKDWLEDNPRAYDELMTMLYKKGIDGDKDAAQYVIDRLKGRPHQSQDIRVKAVPDFTAEDYEDLDRLTELRRQEELKLLEESNDVD